MFVVHAISRLDGSVTDGIHLLWAPPFPTGYSLDGYTILRRPALQQEAPSMCFDLDADRMARLHRLLMMDVPRARVWVRSSEDAPGYGTVHLVARQTYVFDLREAYRRVEVEAGALFAFAARGDGKTVAVAGFSHGRCVLDGHGIRRVVVVAAASLAQVRVCGFGGEDGWEGAEVIAEGLQLPFATVHPGASDLAGERAVAEARLLEGESLEGDFPRLSRLMNLALARPFGLPPWHVIAASPRPEATAWDVQPLGLGLTAALRPEWRRALALGFLDRAERLTEGAGYDYRVLATIPAGDATEGRQDFHSVPRGYELPPMFDLGGAVVWVQPRSTVSTLDPPGSGALQPHLKGIRFETLHIVLPASASRLVLECHADGPLTVRATLADRSTETVSVEASGRVELSFDQPILDVNLRGGGFFAGWYRSPLAAGADPGAPVPLSTTVHGVRFVRSPGPRPVRDLRVENLQAPGDERANDHPGFSLRWRPPELGHGGFDGDWPADLPGAPPLEAAYFLVERSRESDAFEPLDGNEGMVVSGRHQDGSEETPAWDMRVLERFPVHHGPPHRVDHDVRYIDVFPDDDGVAGGADGGGSVPYGSGFRYRVRCVDVLGRQSAPVISSRRVLEKHSPPPPPVSPWATRPEEWEADPEPPDPTRPGGVEVRLLQRDTPELSPEDRARVDAVGHDLVVLRWGWGARERELDPRASRFRVYRHEGSFRERRIEVEGAPVAVPGGWRVPVRFAPSVRSGELAGEYVLLGKRFRIRDHGPGARTDLFLEPHAPDPSVRPDATATTLLSEATPETEPSSWKRRLDLDLPITEELEYELELPANLAPSADRPRVEAWFGVSAADEEAYVPDRRSVPGESPRPGNESAVAAGRVVARWYGRPDLTPADLGAVEVRTAPRREGDYLALELDLGEWLAPAEWGTELLLERAPGGGLLRRLVVGDVIRLRAADGSEVPWPLSAADRASLRTQLEAGEGEVDARFLAGVAGMEGALDDVFERVPEVDHVGPVRDALPSQGERWVYRVRRIDRAGRISVRSQVLPMVIRVPPRRAAPAPALTVLEAAEGECAVEIVTRGQGHDPVLVFHAFESGLRPVPVHFHAIRNRPDLPPTRRFRLRDETGAFLAAEQLDPGAGVPPTSEDDARGATAVWSRRFSVPEGHRLAVWAVAVSADGLPSPLAGPVYHQNGIPVGA